MKKLFVILIIGLLVSGCSTSVITKTEEGNTLNYDIRAEKKLDKETKKCKGITVRVNPLSKLYTSGYEPPNRLKLYDIDCKKPFDFEMARFIADRGGPQQISERGMARFKSRHERLFHEVYAFLFQNGLI